MKRRMEKDIAGKANKGRRVFFALSKFTGVWNLIVDPPGVYRASLSLLLSVTVDVMCSHLTKIVGHLDHYTAMR